MEEGHVAAGASATAGKWTGARGDGCASCAGGQRPDEGAAGPPFLEPRSTLAASPAREGGRRGDEDAAEPATGLGEVELVAVQGGAQACAAATEWLDDVGVAKGDTEWLDDVGVPAERLDALVARPELDRAVGGGGEDEAGAILQGQYAPDRSLVADQRVDAHSLRRAVCTRASVGNSTVCNSARGGGATGGMTRRGAAPRRQRAHR